MSLRTVSEARCPAYPGKANDMTKTSHALLFKRIGISSVIPIYPKNYLKRIIGIAGRGRASTGLLALCLDVERDILKFYVVASDKDDLSHNCRE